MAPPRPSRSIISTLVSDGALHKAQRADDGQLVYSTDAVQAADTHDVRLVARVDVRERAKGSTHSAFDALLTARGVPTESAGLPVGDVVFVAPGPPDLMAPMIVERKTAGDLANSLASGHIHEQRHRLTQVQGATSVLVVEGLHEYAPRHPAQPTRAALETALAETRLLGLTVVQTVDQEGTADVYQAIYVHWAGRAASAGGAGQVDGFIPVASITGLTPSAAPRAALAQRMLMQTPGVSAAGAGAIVAAVGGVGEISRLVARDGRAAVEAAIADVRPGAGRRLGGTVARRVVSAVVDPMG